MIKRVFALLATALAVAGCSNPNSPDDVEQAARAARAAKAKVALDSAAQPKPTPNYRIAGN